MLNGSDLYAATFTSELEVQSSIATLPQLGRVISHVSVTRYIDTRNLTEVPSFLVTCLQRLIVYNQSSPFEFDVLPAGYSGYPALLQANVTPVIPDGTTLTLVDYWPRTLNSSVSTDLSESDTGESNVTRQHTSGSSTTTTNSFGVNVSASPGVGPEGPSLSGTLGGSFEHSTAVSSNVEDMVGSGVSRGFQLTGAASMTIKDWASFATIFVDQKTKVPALRWVWGQEYPWDLFQYRPPTAGSDVTLPQFIQDRLCDLKANWVAPPSHLAIFGLDFIARATWQVIPDAGAVDPPTIGFTLDGQVGQASHSIEPVTSDDELLDADGDPPKPATQVTASMSTENYTTVAIDDLDLELLALDPVSGPGIDNGAAVGFSPDAITKLPTFPGGKFRIVSAANTLALRGAGFLAPVKDSPMSADLSNGATATLDVIFKIVDTDQEYSLIFKHWKTEALGCVLTFSINAGAFTVVRHLDDLEGEGGGNNVTAIALRSFDFTSTDYHDYVRLGTNTISVTLAADPGSPSAPCGYALRALAVG